MVSTIPFFIKYIELCYICQNNIMSFFNISPNTIIYSSANTPYSLRSGVFCIGINDIGYGSTLETDFWNGITPPSYTTPAVENASVEPGAVGYFPGSASTLSQVQIGWYANGPSVDNGVISDITISGSDISIQVVYANVGMQFLPGESYTFTTNVPSGQTYTIYTTKIGSTEPSIKIANNQSEAVAIFIELGMSPDEPYPFVWADENPNVLITNFNYPDIVIPNGNSLVMHIDSSYIASLPLPEAAIGAAIPSTTTWYDVSWEPANALEFTNTEAMAFDGSALFFDGTCWASVISEESIPIGNSNYTINVWFKPLDFTGENALIGWGNYENPNQVNAFRLINDTALVNYWWDNDLSVAYNFVADTWYNATCSFDGTTRKIYVNGTLLGSDTPEGHNVPSANNLTIAYSGVASDPFVGAIQVLSVYNTALTDAQVLSSYQAMLPRFSNSTPTTTTTTSTTTTTTTAAGIITDGLTLNLDAGNPSSYSGTGDTWYDLTDNANNAALINNPTFTNDGVSSYFNFPYTNIYGQINDSASLQFGTGDFTISVWDYPLVVNDLTNQRTILSKNYTGFEIFIYASTLRAYFGGVNELQTTQTLSINTWYNFVFVRNSGVITAYINTIQDGTLVNSTDVSNIGTGLYISIRPSTPYYGEQDISNILLYNVALSEVEILQNFNALASRYGLSPITTTTTTTSTTTTTTTVAGIITDGLTLNLDANSYSGSGTWNDLTTNGFTAAVQGSVPFTSAGDLSYFTFSGSGNYLLGNAGLNTATTNPIDGTLGVTISAIFTMPDVTQPSILFSQLNGGGYNFECGTQPSNLWVETLRSFAASNTSTDDRGTTQVLSNNVIYLMTWTWDQVNKVSTMYVNSTSIAAANSGNPAALTNQWAYNYGASFEICAQTYYSQYGNGNMYKIFAYNRALTAGEVLENYNALQSRFGL